MDLSATIKLNYVSYCVRHFGFLLLTLSIGPMQSLKEKRVIIPSTSYKF